MHLKLVPGPSANTRKNHGRRGQPGSSKASARLALLQPLLSHLDPNAAERARRDDEGQMPGSEALRSVPTASRDRQTGVNSGKQRGTGRAGPALGPWGPRPCASPRGRGAPPPGPRHGQRAECSWHYLDLTFARPQGWWKAM